LEEFKQIEGFVANFRTFGRLVNFWQIGGFPADFSSSGRLQDIRRQMKASPGD
jgi:hypothetical protein